MTRKEALAAGYGKAPKPVEAGDDEVAPAEWHSRLRGLGIPNPEGISRKFAEKLLLADVNRQGQTQAAVAGEERRTEREAPGKARDAAMDLRREFQALPVFKATTDMADAIEKIRSAQDNGTGDLGLIYSYVKMLDPGSVVREGEIQLAAKPTPLLTSLAQQYSRVAQGDLLHPDLRASYKNASEKLWEAQVSRYKQTAEEYKALAGDLGINPGLVVRDYGFKPKASAAPAQITPLDQQAIEWLKKYPNHRSASRVRNGLRARGVLPEGL